MDIFTQGLIGSALSLSIAKKNETKLAAATGFLSGLIADADIFIQSSADPLLTIEYHRHFTHSILFIPLGALIATILCWLLVKDKIAFRRLYLFCLMGYSLSGFIDSCTSYGTYLLWPFYDERLSFHIISIVDPVFTLVLFVTVLLAYIKYKPGYAHMGLVFCCIYLLLGVMQHQRIFEIASNLAKSRGHVVNKLVVKPTLGNILLWRSTYISGGYIYVDAIRAGIYNNIIYKGESVPLFVPEMHALDIPADSILYKDILRFEKFSDGYIAMDPRYTNVLGDIRYSMLPNSTHSLWGITIDKSNYNTHAKYRFYRENNSELRSKFWSMLIDNHENRN